jgi:hypothetical protein
MLFVFFFFQFYREVGFGFDWSTQEWTFLVGLRVDGSVHFFFQRMSEVVTLLY